MTIYACIQTHHLLDHKPDNLLRNGHKCQLSGIYKFGTPGIAILWTDHAVYMENFLDLLKSNMPQKKFQILFQREWSGSSSPISGWNEMASASDLKQALAKAGAPDEDYYIVLGLDPSKGEEDSSSNTAAKGGSKKQKGKKKGGK